MSQKRYEDDSKLVLIMTHIITNKLGYREAISLLQKNNYPMSYAKFYRAKKRCQDINKKTLLDLANKDLPSHFLANMNLLSKMKEDSYNFGSGSEYGFEKIKCYEFARKAIADELKHLEMASSLKNIIHNDGPISESN